MKKILMIGLLLTSFSQLTFAYNDQDLQKLRETCSCQGCDLSNANLANFKLGDNQTLNSQKIKTKKNGFIVCDISNANFSGANLKNAYFSPADFGPGINQKVGQVMMTHTNFNGANLTGAHLNAVTADQSTFNNANLNNASILKGASFKNCNFSYAVMTHVSVAPPMGGCGADFTNSNFYHTNLSNSKINADFTNANFKKANLANSQLMPCDNDPKDGFKQTNFTGANLRNAKFSNQVPTEDLLANAKLCRTKLTSSVSNRDCAN